MLKLHGKVETKNLDIKGYELYTVTTNPNFISSDNKKLALLSDTFNDTSFDAYLCFNDEHYTNKNTIKLTSEYNYLTDGDIIRIDDKNNFACLFRENSRYNTILLTEQCNHYCLMCSQPPKKIDDSWLLDQAFDLIKIIPKNTKWMGFSGGEPTIYDDGFISLINHTKNHLPFTGIDVLTNGRRFANKEFTSKISSINHENLTFGIPLYSHDPSNHNFIVQAEDAFDETVKGILNLKNYSQKVEIRIVLHKQSIPDLIETCRFITRNLLFVDHVALMGLEITGFTRANLNDLWIDPHSYKDILSEAVKILNNYKIPTSIYNHQICILNHDVMGNYQKSISDWKNEYVE